VDVKDVLDHEVEVLREPPRESRGQKARCCSVDEVASFEAGLSVSARRARYRTLFLPHAHARAAAGLGREIPKPFESPAVPQLYASRRPTVGASRAGPGPEGSEYRGTGVPLLPGSTAKQAMVARAQTLAQTVRGQCVRDLESSREGAIAIDMSGKPPRYLATGP
jgi:hypothetical protein